MVRSSFLIAAGVIVLLTPTLQKAPQPNLGCL